MSVRRLVLALLVLALCAPAFADAESGPDRVTMISQPWGTIYHLPFPLDTTCSQDMFGEFTIKARNGAWTSVKQEGHSEGYVVYYPDEKWLSVRKTEGGELQIELRGKKAWFRPMNDGWVLKLPTDEIRLSKHDSTVTISGRQGKTVVVDGPNGFTVTSPAGQSRYGREDFEKPFQFSGVPIQSHPYVVRGLWVESQGMGAFIDLKLSTYSRAFTLLGWYPMLTLGDN